MSFRTPLAVYVVWHPDYLEGQQIADFFYSVLCRDSMKPLIRSIGIPVYFRNTIATGTNQPLKINFDESEYTAVIALISDECVIDKNYANFIDDVFDGCAIENDKRRVYPLALSKHAYNVSTKFSAINFIRVDKSATINAQIKSPILHELCRLLMNMK